MKKLKVAVIKNIIIEPRSTATVEKYSHFRRKFRTSVNRRPPIGESKTALGCRLNKHRSSQNLERKLLLSLW